MDAYVVSKISKHYQHFGMHIECITSYEDTLLVCVKGGQLMKYVRTNQTHHHNKLLQNSARLDLVHHYKTFAPSPINMMRAIPELSCLLVQYGDMIKIHDLDTMELKTALEMTKGVTVFDYCVKERFDEKKKVQVKASGKLAVAVDKKLMIFLWNGETFEDHMIDPLVFSKPVKGLLWCEDVLFVAYKNEYFLLRPETNEIHDLFTYGRNQKQPLMIRVEPDVALILQEKISVFIDCYGKAAKKFNITWSDVPLMIAYNPPYISAVLPGYIEVKTLDPCVSVQRIDLNFITSISQGSGIIYLVTNKTIHTLSLLSAEKRIQGMLHAKRYELAQKILKLTPMREEERALELVRIQSQQAVHYFCLQQFDEAFRLFLDLNTDPSHVVGLFPSDMIPKDFKLSLEYSEKIPFIQGDVLQTALADLVCYLQERRKLVVRDIELQPFTPVMVHRKNVTLETKEKTLQLIDTMLLKCYIKFNTAINEKRLDELIDSPDNRVIIQEAVTDLKAAGKYRQIVKLYKMHQMHDMALSRLKCTAGTVKKGNIPSRLELAISYMQDLGKDHEQLILKHAVWILDCCPKDAVMLFTKNMKTVKEWPRDILKNLIEKKDADLAIEYLEHVIYEWHDDSSDLHLSLCQLLTNKINKLQAKSGHTEILVKDETGPLRAYRNKLIKFLKTSRQYQADKILLTLPSNSFFEERALLLGRQGRHMEALGIYLYVLEAHDQAEEYCFDHYSSELEGDRHVYLTLVKVYLNPPRANELGLSQYKVVPVPDKRRAMFVLQNNSSKIDLLQAFEILPEDIPIKSARMFIENAMETIASRKHANKIKCGLLKYNADEVQKEKWLLSRKPICIKEQTVCDGCAKHIGKSIFVRTFDEQILHMHCYTERTGK